MKKTYERPQIEIKEFQLDEICAKNASGSSISDVHQNDMLFGFDVYLD